MTRTGRPRWKRHRGGDRGSMSLFYAVLIVAVLSGIALVVDGGGRLQEGARATMLAQEAARVGGQQIDPAKAIPGTAIVADPAAAKAAAEEYLRQAGVDGTVTVSPDGKTLTVTVVTEYHTVMASLIGYTTMPVTGHGTATLTTGG